MRKTGLGFGVWGLVMGEVARRWVVTTGVNFFGSGIPGMSQVLGVSKTGDLVYVGVALVVGLGLGWIAGRLVRGGAVFAMVAGAMFVVTHVASWGTKDVMVIFGLSLVWLVVVKVKKWETKWDWQVGVNALAVGWWVTLVVRMVAFSPVLAWGMGILTVGSWVMACGKHEKLRDSGWIIVVAAMVGFANWLWLLGMMVMAMVAVKLGWGKWVEKWVWVVVVVWVGYNPLFYYGNFDRVEEGFWLAWVQRVDQGVGLFKDALLFHGPIQVWGIYGVMKLTSWSVYGLRLYMQGMQIAGMIVVALVIGKVIKEMWTRVVVFGLVVAVVSEGVRNNVEIRLGVGLVAIWCSWRYMETGQRKWLVMAGLVTGGAIVLSPEVGLATLVACGVGWVVKQKKALVTYGLGVVATVVFVWMGLGIQAGEVMWQTLGRYGQEFSQGYFNVAVPRFETGVLVDWPKLDSMVQSEAMWWVLSLVGIVLVMQTKGPKRLEITMLVVFELVLVRAALGRSDWYHLAFVLVVGLITFGWWVEQMERQYPKAGLIVWGVMVGVFGRNIVGRGVVGPLIGRVQSYGRIEERYQTYINPRMQIAVGVDVDTKTQDELWSYIQQQTNEDEGIFVYPWSPEIYFLTNRRNVTNVDTPYSFFAPEYQKQMVDQLVANKPKLIVYEPNMGLGGLTADSLGQVNDYILANYAVEKTFGVWQVMRLKKDLIFGGDKRTME